jgi:hypothetical protein
MGAWCEKESSGKRLDLKEAKLDGEKEPYMEENAAKPIIAAENPQDEVDYQKFLENVPSIKSQKEDVNVIFMSIELANY